MSHGNNNSPHPVTIVAAGRVRVAFKPHRVNIGGSGKPIGFNPLARTAPARLKGFFEASIEEERILRVSADEAFAAVILTLTASLYDPEVGYVTQAQLVDEQFVRATADTAEAGHRLTLDAQVNHADTGLPNTRARLISEENARATADSAEAFARLQLEGTVFAPGTGLPATLARLVSEESVRATADTAEAAARATLSAQVNHATTGLPATLARLVTEETTRATADTAAATRTASLEATVRSGADLFNARLTYNFQWATLAGWTNAFNTTPNAGAGEYLILTQTVANGNFGIRGPAISPVIPGTQMQYLRMRFRRDAGTLSYIVVYYSNNVHGEHGGYFLQIVPPAADVPLGQWVVLEFNSGGVANQPSVGWDYLNSNISQLRIDFVSSTDFACSIQWIAAGNYAPAEYQARVTVEESARVSADAAEAALRVTLSAQVNHATTGLPATLARLVTEESTRATADSALSTRTTTLESQVAGGTASFLNSRIATEETTRANADTALATRTTTLEASSRGGDGFGFNARLTYTFSWVTAAGWTDAFNATINPNGGDYMLITMSNTVHGGMFIRGPLITPAIGGTEMVRVRMRVRRESGSIGLFRLYYSTAAGGAAAHGESGDFYMDIPTTDLDLPLLQWVVLEFAPLSSANQPTNGYNWLNSFISQIRLDCYGTAAPNPVSYSIQWIAGGGIAPPAYQARVTVEETARVSADSALASRSTTLESQMAGGTASFLNSRIATEESTRVSAVAAVASRASTLESQMAGGTASFLNSRIATEESTRATADSALGTRTTTVEATLRTRDEFNARLMWNFQVPNVTNWAGWVNTFNANFTTLTDSLRLTQQTATGAMGIHTTFAAEQSYFLQHLRLRIRRAQGILSTIRQYYTNNIHGQHGGYYGDLNPTAAQLPLGEWVTLDMDMLVVPNQASVGYEYINQNNLSGLRWDFYGSTDLIIDIMWTGAGTVAAPDYRAFVKVEETARITADNAEAALRQSVAVIANGISAQGALTMIVQGGPAGYTAQYTLALVANGQSAGLRVRVANSGLSDIVLSAERGYLEHISVAGGVPQLLWSVQNGRFVLNAPVTVRNNDIGQGEVLVGTIGAYNIGPPINPSILGANVQITAGWQAFLGTSVFLSPEYELRLDFTGNVYCFADSGIDVGSSVYLRVRDDWFGVLSERLVAVSPPSFQSCLSISEVYQSRGYSGVRSFWIDLILVGGSHTHHLLPGAKLLPTVRYRG